MSSSFALTACAVAGMLIGNLAVMADRSQRDFEHESAVKNTADEMVVNNTADVVTETEIYKIVCVAPADTFCKEYSVRRINKE